MKTWTINYRSGGLYGQARSDKISGESLIEALESPAFAEQIKRLDMGNAAGYQLIQVRAAKCEPNTTCAGRTFANIYATSCGCPLVSGHTGVPVEKCIADVLCLPEEMPADVVLWSRSTPLEGTP